MYKVLAILLVVAVAANAGLVYPLIGGVSHTQRIQSHIPLGVYGVGIGKGIGLGGIGGIGLGGIGYGGIGGIGLGHGLIGGGIIG